MITISTVDTLAVARQARARRDAFVGQMLRGWFATLFQRNEQAPANPGLASALSPLGAAAR
ncbi:MAG: hypothetical protein R3E83_09825 [Burkholderiaceae bacterium]